MGDPRKQKNKYSGPRHPWEATRILEEKSLLRDYGLKTKKDIWKQLALVKNIKRRVKRINSAVGQSMAQEREDLIRKLRAFNLLQEDQPLDEALNLTIENILERRLQTQVVRANLAKTMSQARQFIVHGHIVIDGKKLTSPSYQVTREEQFKIAFIEKSSLFDEEHPERKAPEVVPKVEVDAEAKAAEELALAEDEVSKEIGDKIDADSDVEVEDASKDAKKATKEDTKPATEKVVEDKKDE
jgi:small subunit ribosomal protein S4